MAPVIALAVVVGCRPADHAASVLVTAADAPTRNTTLLYEDDEFRFVSRHFGDARDSGGTTEPGLFVHSRDTGRWLRVMAVSTAGGRFGRSEVLDSSGRPVHFRASVVWDFRPLATQSFADQPLRTSGSVVFPDTIRYHPATGRYALHYHSSWGIPEAETVLYVQRSDLTAAFHRP
jgi:hypothetical protein